ncbi:ParM/StbA family protein [Bacillus pseudomycoides]|uniref:ParM/StbA family protein n=1 Tax=Bacillus pseudomycoides TaxID=64104 RepID=UPI000BFC04DE|nr:ParM/StbA family protein [Bacillus pseudomycoides]PGD99974.1 peptide ABC transporter substrate-binding protein [Bacillus pseudomycoides]PHG23830.1 peptide ABC transporter substrate-binding protein [Bacillus pseudomycoides]
MAILKAGADAGNSGLKLAVLGQDPLFISSIYSHHIGEATNILSEEDISVEELENNIDVTISSPALSVNNMRYIIGQKVIDENIKGIEMEKKSDKSKDDLVVLVTLAGLAVSAMKKQPNKDKIDVTFDLSVALPVATITPKTAEEFAQRYMNHHTVKFHHPSGREVIINIQVEYCKCLPEGAAGAWGVVYDEKGKTIKRKVEVGEDKIVETDFVDKTLLSFDIGAGTTEEVVSQGVSFKHKMSRGLPYGVKETLLDIIKVWNLNNKQKTIDSIAEFNAIYLDSEHPRHTRLKEASRGALLGLANRIATDIINKIDDMKDDPYVFIYGGGAAIVKESLQQILEQKGRLTNVVFLKDPLFVNSRGLLVYTCSPRFDVLKEKALIAATGEK